MSGVLYMNEDERLKPLNIDARNVAQDIHLHVNGGAILVSKPNGADVVVTLVSSSSEANQRVNVTSGGSRIVARRLVVNFSKLPMDMEE